MAPQSRADGTGSTIVFPRARWFESPGLWYWALVLVGATLRYFLATQTRGTQDCELWTQHAEGIAARGLIPYYAAEPLFNHPPFVGWVMARLGEVASAWGIEFRDLYRPIVATFDLLNIALVWLVLRENRLRWLVSGLYAVAPIALVLAGYHGNTDAVIATCLLGCVLLASSNRPILTGIVLGLSAWIKLPGLIAAPTIGFALPSWRDRILCALVALTVGSAGYAPAWMQASDYLAANSAPGLDQANLVGERVLGYQGRHVRTLGDPPTYIWGMKNFLLPLLADPRTGPPMLLRWWLDQSHWLALAVLWIFAFLRRRERTAVGLATTLAGTFVLFYGLVETCTWQYFAWSMPLWLIAGIGFGTTCHTVSGGYVYALYAYVTGDLLLRPEWDFVGHPDWPTGLLWARNLAVLGCLALGMTAFGRALSAARAARAGGRP
jgi:hypothetical protein